MVKTKVIVYSAGLVHCSVCAPSDMDRAEIESQVSTSHPTGLDHGWRIDDVKEFADGSGNPHVCETDADRLHYLMVC